MSLLVVAEDERLLETWKRDLRILGGEVWAAMGFESTIDVLLKITPQAAVVDTRLPTAEVARLLNLLQHCLIPVVLLVDDETGHARWSKDAGQRDVVLASSVEQEALIHWLKQWMSVGL